MRSTLLASTALAAALLISPAAAEAHVTVQPSTAPAGAGDTRLDIRVPNERDDANTVKVDVKFPPGFAQAAYQPVPGWNVKVTNAKLAKPIQTDDGPVTESVSRITWTARTTADGIPPGAFQDFGLSVLVPDKAGTTLTFKALQTYSNGTVVRWIGAKDSDTPAPTVQVTAADGGAPAATPTPRATAAPSSASGGSSNGLAVTALIVGALGLVTGVVALLAARRSRRVRA